jgi:transposase
VLPRYSMAFKAKMIQRMLGPDQRSASALSREMGVSQVTLSRWKREGRTLGVMSSNNKDQSKRRKRARKTPADRLRLLAASESLSGDELGAFLRQEGLHSVDLARWREQALRGLEADSRGGKKTPEQKELQELRRELHRKDTALAETAALLVLKKKVQQIWGDEDDDTRARSGS